MAMTDEEKHAECIRKTGLCCTFISQALYDAAEKQGIDLRRFVAYKPIPTTDGPIYTYPHNMPTSEQMRAEVKRKIDAGEPLGTSHVHEHDYKPGDEVLGYGTLVKSDEYSYAKLKAPGEYAEIVFDGHGTPYVRGRKSRRDDRICSGKDCHCMDGKNGKCVLCDNHD